MVPANPQANIALSVLCCLEESLFTAAQQGLLEATPLPFAEATVQVGWHSAIACCLLPGRPSASQGWGMKGTCRAHALCLVG